MSVEEMYEKYADILQYEIWRNMEMRQGKLSMQDFNNLPPFVKISMYDEWIKKGKWEYGIDEMGR